MSNQTQRASITRDDLDRLEDELAIMTAALGAVTSYCEDRDEFGATLAFGATLQFGRLKDRIYAIIPDGRG